MNRTPTRISSSFFVGRVLTRRLMHVGLKPDLQEPPYLKEVSLG